MNTSIVFLAEINLYGKFKTTENANLLETKNYLLQLYYVGVGLSWLSLRPSDRLVWLHGVPDARSARRRGGVLCDLAADSCRLCSVSSLRSPAVSFPLACEPRVSASRGLLGLVSFWSNWFWAFRGRWLGLVFLSGSPSESLQRVVTFSFGFRLLIFLLGRRLVGGGERLLLAFSARVFLPFVLISDFGCMPPAWAAA